MFSYSFYSFLHISAVITIMMSLAITAMHIAQGGTKQNLKARKGLAITHGISLLVALVAGFGLMARAGYQFSSSPWIHIKLLCWVLLGAYPLFLYRGWIPRRMALVGFTAVALLAIYTVVFKPI